jgi:hypothetical protein
MFGTITQRSKGCLICSGIIQWSIQRVAYVCCTIHKVQRTICQWMSSPPTDIHTKRQKAYVWWSQRMSTLKDKTVRLPNLAYIWFKSQIPQNAFLVDPSDPKSKLTL